ncbi:MAG TPA: extracellular solute-binding protein, partial [Elusimicrobiota bacterium]|nr:extracellular solute-binding protein [Elusimicrobiota bacterium]
MARKFEQLHPGVAVETQAIPWEAAHAKLLTSVVGGIPPDVSQLGTTWMAEFAAMRALEPLDAHAQRSSVAKPAAFFDGSLRTCRVDGILYGLPWYVDTRVLFYRKDLLAEVGFKEPPKTWEELKVAGRRLAERKNPDGKKSFGVALGTRSWTELLLFVWQNGGDPLRPSAMEFFDAMRFYISLFREGITPTKEAADLNKLHAFKTGFFPMFVSGPWEVELLRKELPELEGRWGIGLLPGKKSRTSFVGGCNLVVFRDSRKKELAWEFLEFMSEPQNQIEWLQLTNDLPSVKAAWEHAYFADKPLLKVFGRQMYDTASPPTIPEWEQIASLTENAMEKIILDEHITDNGVMEQLLTLEASILKLRSENSARPGTWRAFLLFIAALVALGGGFWMLRSFPRLKITGDKTKAPALSWQEFRRKDLFGLLFILPALLLLVVFLFLPIAVSFVMSLTDLNIFSINQWSRIQFVGWQNYLRILQDPLFWKSLWNTLYFAGVGVPLTIAVSLLAAVALNQ